MAKKISNFTGMRNVLIQAHNDNNGHAIRRADVTAVGVQQAWFDAWCEDVEELRKQALGFAKVTFDRTYTKGMSEDDKQKEVRALKTKMFKELKEIASCIETTGDSHNIVLCEADAYNIARAAWRYAKSEAGTQTASQTAELFRKEVETYFGVLACNDAMLTDEQRDKLEEHYNNISKVNSCKSRIESCEAEIKVFEDAKAKCADEASKNVFEAILVPKRAALHDLKNELAAAENLKDASKAGFDEVNSSLIKPEVVI